MDGRQLTWTAFLLVCFGLVGLAGLFGIYAAPIPLERALARNATLDRVLDAARQPDPAPLLERLRPALAESAAPVLTGPGTLEERVAREREAVRARQEAEARGVARRLRLLVLVITAMAGLFGALVLGLARR